MPSWLRARACCAARQAARCGSGSPVSGGGPLAGSCCGCASAHTLPNVLRFACRPCPARRHSGPTAAQRAQPTGALDTATEAALYGLLQRGGRSFVSVGHREQLVQWHTHVLEHAGGPRWRLSTRQEVLARRQAGAGGAEQPG